MEQSKWAAGLGNSASKLAATANIVIVNEAIKFMLEPDVHKEVQGAWKNSENANGAPPNSEPGG